MKLSIIFFAALAFSAAAFGQTICDSPATGPQPYSLTEKGPPQPGVLPLLGYFAGDTYVALPGMPTPPTSFCGPLWEGNYSYVPGNMIEPLPPGAVFQAVVNPGCATGCKSGATQPAGFGGVLFLPSPVAVYLSSCSDTGTTATCDTVDLFGNSAPVNVGEPNPGAAVGSTFVIQNFANSAYNGSWVVTGATNTLPYTVSFTASGLGNGSCSGFGGTACLGYQRGTQVADNTILWQYVGPQNETALLTPAVTVTPSSSSITTAQSLNVTVAVGGGSGNPTPTGSVTLTSGNYLSAPATLSGGSATINIPTCSLPVGKDTLTASYPGDSNYAAATGVNSVTVTAAPCFTISGSPVSVLPGATTGNASTITVTPVNGFTGSVALTAVIASSPAGAQDLPTLSSIGSVTLAGTAPASTTVTVSTTAPGGSALAYAGRTSSGWFAAAAGLVGFTSIFGIEIGVGIGIGFGGRKGRRSGRRIRLGALVLLVTLISACGNSSGSRSSSSGTTPGTYTVTVTGTSNGLTAAGTVIVTVQ
jgi:hypothetical protein